MSQISEFTLPPTQQIWKQKCLKLQNQLLEVRVQQINLKRINRSLQQTLKLALSQDLPESERNSTQRINLTWKEKYEQELEKNLDNQKYIKVLEAKRNKQASRTHKKRQYSTNVRVSASNNNEAHHYTRYTPTPLTSVDIYPNMNTRQQPRKSVKKMQGFMEKLMKEKYAISDFGFDNYVQNYPIEVGRGKEGYCQKDPIEKLFGSVKGIKGIKRNKENYETEEQELPLKVRNTVSCQNNHVVQRSVSAQLVEKTMGKRVAGTAQFR